MGLTVVITQPASMAPNKAIGYSGMLGKQTATTSPLVRWNFVCRRMASAAQWSRNLAYVYDRSVMAQTCETKMWKSVFMLSELRSGHVRYPIPNHGASTSVVAGIVNTHKLSLMQTRSRQTPNDNHNFHYYYHRTVWVRSKSTTLPQTV